MSVPSSLPLTVPTYSLNIVFPTYLSVWPYINSLLGQWNLDELSCCYSFCSKISYSYLVQYFVQNFTRGKELKYNTQICHALAVEKTGWYNPGRIILQICKLSAACESFLQLCCWIRPYHAVSIEQNSVVSHTNVWRFHNAGRRPQPPRIDSCPASWRITFPFYFPFILGNCKYTGRNFETGN